ncbi:hypothetical protein MMC22_009968 [Lobaria immixta]|nr:hypothetical protein [Lobaria immixta]
MTTVSLPAISEAQSHRFAYFRPEETGFVKFLSPRTILTQFSVATATSGQILPIRPPFTNASYQIRFPGPKVKCGDANATIVRVIDKLKEQKSLALNPSIVEVSSSYFAFVPDLNSETIQAADLSNPQWQTNASNQLWMVFPRYTINEHGRGELRKHHLICQLHNASYEASLSFTEGVQTVDILNLTVLNAIDFPKNGLVFKNNTVRLAYTAAARALYDQLTGDMGIYHEVLTDNSTHAFGLINTRIAQTNLLGSSDLATYFNENHALHPAENSGVVSDQRAEDIAKAKNRTLDVLIEELSHNITLSLMSSNLLSPSVISNVTTTAPLNVYAYEPRNLLVAYAIAILTALLANLIGAVTYISNGLSYDMSFSTILRTTRSADLSQLFKSNDLGAQPLPKSIGQQKLRFGIVAEARKPDDQHLQQVVHTGFGLKNNVVELKKNRLRARSESHPEDVGLPN